MLALHGKVIQREVPYKHGTSREYVMLLKEHLPLLTYGLLGLPHTRLEVSQEGGCSCGYLHHNAPLVNSIKCIVDGCMTSMCNTSAKTFLQHRRDNIAAVNTRRTL